MLLCFYLSVVRLVLLRQIRSGFTRGLLLLLAPANREIRDTWWFQHCGAYLAVTAAALPGKPEGAVIRPSEKTSLAASDSLGECPCIRVLCRRGAVNPTSPSPDVFLAPAEKVSGNITAVTCPGRPSACMMGVTHSGSRPSGKLTVLRGPLLFRRPIIRMSTY